MLLGLAMWHSELSCHFQGQHLIWVLLQVPTALLPRQLPANVPGKAVMDDPNTWVPATHMGRLGGPATHMGHLGGVLGSSIPPGPAQSHGGHLRREAIWGRSLSLSLFFSLPFHCSAFQINRSLLLISYEGKHLSFPLCILQQCSGSAVCGALQLKLPIFPADGLCFWCSQRWERERGHSSFSGALAIPEARSGFSSVSFLPWETHFPKHRRPGVQTLPPEKSHNQSPQLPT